MLKARRDRLCERESSVVKGLEGDTGLTNPLAYRDLPDRGEDARNPPPSEPEVISQGTSLILPAGSVPDQLTYILLLHSH